MSELLAFLAARIRDGTEISLSYGAGRDTCGTGDSFHFVYQAFLDGEIGSNPPSLENTSQFVKIGLMIRESLSTGSPHVILDVKPNNSVEFMTRSTLNGETHSSPGTGRAH